MPSPVLKSKFKPAAVIDFEQVEEGVVAITINGVHVASFVEEHDKCHLELMELNSGEAAQLQRFVSFDKEEPDSGPCIHTRVI